jgi:hypothetical protein
MPRDHIQMFFQVWDDKISFLRQLFDDGHYDEAATLCYVYIDGFAQAFYWPDRHSGRNFVKVLREHGGEPHLDLIYPPRFLRWVREDGNKKVKKLAQKLESALQPYETILASEPDVRAVLQQTLSQNELQQLVCDVWRGTLASSAYEWLRNPFVHGLRSYSGIRFTQVTYQGGPVPEINFLLLHEALTSIAHRVRELSEWSGSLCIHV